MTLSDALHQVAERREQADIEALTAVYCLHLVLGSGSYTRLEELNSTQLSCRAVRSFFDNKRAFYEQRCDFPAETVPLIPLPCAKRQARSLGCAKPSPRDDALSA